MNSFIYLRTLRNADHAVFCVADGQKTYYNAQFGKPQAYSSGQQVKRSIIEALLENLGEALSPVTFFFDVKEGKPKEAEVLSLCNPMLTDQLIGGWMSAESRKNDDDKKSRTLKRRSPLSISAMRPLHPLLSTTNSENLSFDRSEKESSREVKVRDKDGNYLSEEQISELLSGTDRSLARKWIQNNRRTTGLFVQDTAVDLRTLFCVNTNVQEPEVSKETIIELKSKGWTEGKNVFGDCLIAPKEMRDQVIPALAHALLHWRITSNQSRTFSLMETLAVAISPNANKVAAAIRAKLKDDEQKVDPIVDDQLEDVNTFITLPAAGYVRTTTEAADALEKAEEKLITMMQNFSYEDYTTT